MVGKVERQAAELKIIADQDGTGHGENDYDHRSLEAKEVAIHLPRAVQLQSDAPQASELGRVSPEHHDIDNFLIHLRLNPGQQILAEEEHKKKQQAEGIQHPKELAAEHLAQGNAGDGENGPAGTSKLPRPSSVVQEVRPHLNSVVISNQ